jgi:hypothetical protein
MYPRLSISNKKPSAQITGPLSNLSLSIFVVIFFLQVNGEKKLIETKEVKKLALLSFLVL